MGTRPGGMVGPMSVYDVLRDLVDRSSLTAERKIEHHASINAADPEHKDAPAEPSGDSTPPQG